MSQLLEDAISRLRNLPDFMQDLAARQLIRNVQFEEEAQAEDIEAIEEGSLALRNGDFVSLDQWKHDMGLCTR